MRLEPVSKTFITAYGGVTCSGIESGFCPLNELRQHLSNLSCEYHSVQLIDLNTRILKLLKNTSGVLMYPHYTFVCLLNIKRLLGSLFDRSFHSYFDQWDPT